MGKDTCHYGHLGYGFLTSKIDFLTWAVYHLPGSPPPCFNKRKFPCTANDPGPTGGLVGALLMWPSCCMPLLIADGSIISLKGPWPPTHTTACHSFCCLTFPLSHLLSTDSIFVHTKNRALIKCGLTCHYRWFCHRNMGDLTALGS